MTIPRKAWRDLVKVLEDAAQERERVYGSEDELAVRLRTNVVRLTGFPGQPGSLAKVPPSEQHSKAAKANAATATRINGRFAKK